MTSQAVKRKAYSSHLSTAVNKLNTALGENSDEQTIQILLERVDLKYKRLEDASDTLQEKMEETELLADMDKMNEIENAVTEVRVKAKHYIEKLKEKAAKENPPQPTTVYVEQQPQQLAAKLPEAKLQEFLGDEESFPSFLDNFTALVDSNPLLPEVEKFAYLRGCVKVDVINHFPLIASNYKPALEKLKRTYGDTNLIATKHLNSLLDMPKRKKPTNLEELQEFFNFIETKMTCLEAIKHPIDPTNQMLVTLIYRQLPKNLRKQIVQSGPILTVPKVMEVISQHITTSKQMKFRDETDESSESDNEDKSYNRVPNANSRSTNPFFQENSNPSSSSSSFPVVNKRFTCVYCNQNHSSVYCQNITNVDERKEILRKANRCFNCLLNNHKVQDCRSTGRCRHCQRKHNSSICINPEPKNEQSRNSNENRNINSGYQGVTTGTSWEASKDVLLQMAQAKVKHPSSSTCIAANIFFDIGSQWSYCTEEIRKKLNLEILHKDVIGINTFGNKESFITNSNVVALEISKGGFNKTITVHTSPSICNPLPSYTISRRKLKELKDIELAFPEVKYEGNHQIDVLIGADLYWEFIGTESISTSFGARAVNSKVGWILSGPISNNSTTTTSINIVNTRLLETLKLDSISPNKMWVNESIANLSNSISTNYELDIGYYNKHSPQHERKQKSSKLTYVNTILNTYDHTQQQLNPDPVEKIDEWFPYQSKISESCTDISWFWKLEHIGIMPEENEPTVLQQFTKNISYEPYSKRYEVEFPCKSNMLNDLPDNYHLCEIRLHSLLKKLNKDENKAVLKAYEEIISKQLEQNIIEEVQSNLPPNGIVHYLPHHCVINTEKETTKVRIVYDGSAKANRKSLSLNQCLHAGPSLVNNMIDVLLQFRLYKIGIIADISKAFLQIQVRENDRDLTRFIWKENGDINAPLKTYRFRRVPFGLASSPFLLNATLKFHIKKYEESSPELVSKLLQSFYVDDMVTGADSVNEGINLVQESYKLMNEASMSLNKWNSNSKEIISNHSMLNMEIPDKTTIKVLGLLWNTLEDHFQYDTKNIVSLIQTLKPSKRTILRAVQKIYDPLGFLAPYVITAKLILQNLCKTQVSWDENLPEQYLVQWQTWVKDLNRVNELNIPRYVDVTHSSDIEIIGFCDASKSAYAATVYLRVEKNNIFTTNLLISKSRVAPMKSLTIPRLELLGAVLLVRLVSTVKKCLSTWNITNTYYFSDSMNVIYWILGTKKWNAFISKRLDEIYHHSSKTQWHHCQGQSNPADLATRGISVEELLTNQVWYHGPQFLSDDITKDSCQITKPPADCLVEELKSSHSHVLSIEPNLNEIIKINNYSKYMKLLRISAYVFMFIHLKIKKINVSYIEMIEHAEKRWIMAEQTKYYSDIIKFLSGKLSKKPNTLVNQLSLFLDSDGIIRCSGRYKYTDISYKLKYPILLPKQSYLTSLIIHHRHVRAKHAGIKITLLEVREDFWVPSIRKLVQVIINRCVICRRLNAKPFVAPIPPPLPPTRLSDLPPFTHTGVDYAGPLYLKERGCKDAYKAYIALFTCASSRALHLELVPSMNSASFMNSLIRFVSIWGSPRYIISDNAKSFKKSAEDLNCIITRSPTKEYLEDFRIVWLFYLEKSPWWGGFIERLVGSIKGPLRKILYRTFLCYDDMSTLVKQIQSIINSRPITYVYTDDVDEPLTPSHLLIGKRSTQLPIPRNTVEDTDKPNQYRENLKSKFQIKWKKEYLSELQDHHIRTQKAQNKESYPTIGDVVIMKEDSLRTNWKLARVTNIFTGRDGNIRSIEIMKPNKEITRRPPQLLVPLEL